jgi:hypothetical protein
MRPVISVMTVTARSSRPVAFGVALVLATASVATRSAAEEPDAARAVRAEIDRLQRSLTDHPIAGSEMEGLASSCDTARAFGDITAVPTLFLFDRQGRTAGVSYGAPPDLLQQVERKLDALLGG